MKERQTNGENNGDEEYRSYKIAILMSTAENSSQE